MQSIVGILLTARLRSPTAPDSIYGSRFGGC
jgi:hypothetical protein